MQLSGAAEPSLRRSLPLTVREVVVERTDAGDIARRILNRVSLFIEPGIVLAVTGPSGAGKTTLAEALLFGAGAIRAKGSLTRGTTVCDHDPQARRHHHTMAQLLEILGLTGELIAHPGRKRDLVGEHLADGGTMRGLGPCHVLEHRRVRDGGDGIGARLGQLAERAVQELDPHRAFALEEPAQRPGGRFSDYSLVATRE